MRRLPPLNALRFFEAAARHSSFLHAAKELHVTASAISHQIRTLEEFVGTPLFRRDGRQVLLTHEGENYLQAVREGLALLAAATDRLVAPRSSGILTLSVAPAFATPWLVPRLAAFQLKHPDIEVRLISSLDLVDFSKSDVDAAIRYGAGRWPGLQSHRLFSDDLVPVASHPSEGSRTLQTPQIYVKLLCSMCCRALASGGCGSVLLVLTTWMRKEGQSSIRLLLRWMRQSPARAWPSPTAD
jgi:LysR family glycine cleavage system transcriptional activator